MSGIPILVDGAAVAVLVVGGGGVAARKASALADGGVRVRVVASAACDEMRALASAGRVSLALRAYADGDVGDAELVIAATNDRDTNARVAADARALHRLVNVADRAEEGTFSSMAAHRAGPLVVGVSAGVPAAAARIRDAIASRFDDRYARALGTLVARRDALLREGRGDEWRAESGRLLDERFCGRVDDGSLAERVG